jgi:hypothetical protein
LGAKNNAGHGDKSVKAKNFGLDVNLIRTDGGHGGRNKEFRRAADTIGNLR